MRGVTVKGGENGTRAALALLRFIPLDIELPAPLQRGPRVIGEDSHSSAREGITAFGRDGKHCPHARYRSRGGGGERLKWAAEYGAARNDRSQHHGQANIDAIDGATVDFARRVDPAL